MSTPPGKPNRAPKVRLAEGGAPTEALEAAIEARLDQIFLDAVEAGGEPLTDFEREALLRRTRYRVRDEAGEEVVPPTLYEDLKRCGVLSPEEMRAVEVELEAYVPGAAHGYAPSVPPLDPTDAPPGSEEKIKVMRQRFLRRQSLHHPGDRKIYSHPLFQKVGRPHDDADE